MAGTGIGTFNDRLRDAVRGGGSFERTRRCRASPPGCSPTQRRPVNGSPTAARRCCTTRSIKVGLTGNLADVPVRRLTPAPSRPARRSTTTARRPATPPRRARRSTYVDAHDNEILYDALAFKLPRGTSAADRARMQVLALSLVVLGQGVGFVAPGRERLRSKSLDRNSYNSGDWFNAIRWDGAAGNGFGLGLPPAADNEDKWPYARPLLADPALVPPARRDRADRRPVRRAAADPRPRRCSACRPPTRCSAGLSVPAVRPGRDPGRGDDVAGRRGGRTSWSCSTPRRRR